mmetsp:Transcript_11978/g.27756  ORF Transcript_11978/g.27756 Transcript_11978/m.27756 type:complete len:255 (-) Transcript_11978:250-1014(-)
MSSSARSSSCASACGKRRWPNSRLSAVPTDGVRTSGALSGNNSSLTQEKTEFTKEMSSSISSSVRLSAVTAFIGTSVGGLATRVSSSLPAATSKMFIAPVGVRCLRTRGHEPLTEPTMSSGSEEVHVRAVLVDVSEVTEETSSEVSSRERALPSFSSMLGSPRMATIDKDVCSLPSSASAPAKLRFISKTEGSSRLSGRARAAERMWAGAVAARRRASSHAAEVAAVAGHEFVGNMAIEGVRKRVGLEREPGEG